MSRFRTHVFLRLHDHPTTAFVRSVADDPAFRFQFGEMFFQNSGIFSLLFVAKIAFSPYFLKFSPYFSGREEYSYRTSVGAGASPLAR